MNGINPITNAKFEGIGLPITDGDLMIVGARIRM